MKRIFTPALGLLLLAGCTSSEPQTPAYSSAAGSTAPMAADLALPPPATPGPATNPAVQATQPVETAQPPSAVASYPEAPPATGNCRTAGNVTTCDAPPGGDDTLYTN